MITTATAVAEIVTTTDIIPPDIDPELLNLSSLARKIHPLVEAKVKRPVKVATITVCLARMVEQDGLRVVKLPKVSIDAFNMQSGLVELSYPKTPEVIAAARRLHMLEGAIGSRNFFTVTYGISEVSIIAKKEMLPAIYDSFAGQTPKIFVDNLGCLAVQFPAEYIEVPYVIFTVTRALIAGRINIVEVVSTFTELVFVLAEDDLQKALQLLSGKK